MTRFRTIRIASLLAVAGMSGPAPTATTAAPAAAPACADFLARMGKAPRHVAFVGCRYLPDRQGKPLVATYRVEGRHAAAAEATLVRSVGLERLRRSCCRWDASAHGFRGTDGRDYTIATASGETTIATRARWPRIAVFGITVETLTEEV